MTFEHINFFLTCAACLNFSHAAKYNFVSVSTLSRSISSLEEQLGVKLFERGFHGHKLTAEGEEFYESCIKSSIEINKYFIKHGKYGKDVIKLGCSPNNSGFKRLVNAGAEIPSDLFTKNFRFFFLDDESIIEALTQGNIDLAILDSELIDEFLPWTDKMLFFIENNREYMFVSRGNNAEKYI